MSFLAFNVIRVTLCATLVNAGTLQVVKRFGQERDTTDVKLKTKKATNKKGECLLSLRSSSRDTIWENLNATQTNKSSKKRVTFENEWKLKNQTNRM